MFQHQMALTTAHVDN